MFPSKRIKPSIGAVRISPQDGKMLIGRVINSTENDLSVMLVGNHVIKIPRADILTTADEKKSLMYEKLLTNMTEEQKQSLLDYIVSLSR